MTAVYTAQYQPVSDAETASGSALSVRAARDLADSMNNAKRYAMVDKVLSHITPLGTESLDSYTDERVSLVFAPRIVPRGFPYLRFFLGSDMVTEGGSTNWTLYCMPSQYRGGVAFSTSMLPVGTTNASVQSTASHNIATNTLTLARGYNDECWFMLTSINSGALYRAKVYTLDAWPVMDELPAETGLE